MGKNIKAAVLGAAGRMGKCIIKRINETEGIELGAAIEKPGHPQLGEPAEDFTGIRGLKIPLIDDLKKVLPEIDVVIDFTTPKSTLLNAELIAKGKKPVVIGTTGFSSPEVELLKQILAGVSWVFSPNMSIGVNVMFKIINTVAQILKEDYEVEIIEIHHRQKQDAPSGTATCLGNIIAQARKQDWENVTVFGRKGITGERKPEEIGIHAVRAGDIIGEHTVFFAGLGERLEITHRAHSRDNFANGAVKAALWVISQPPGMYTMEDVLGLT